MKVMLPPTNQAEFLLVCVRVPSFSSSPAPGRARWVVALEPTQELPPGAYSL